MAKIHVEKKNKTSKREKTATNVSTEGNLFENDNNCEESERPNILTQLIFLF